MTMFLPEVLQSSRMQSAGALRAEDLLPSLAYKELVENLGPLTELGVFEEGGLATALAVARLVDRGRILRSGLSARNLTEALAKYRRVTVHPVRAIERALERAITLAHESEVAVGS